MSQWTSTCHFTLSNLDRALCSATSIERIHCIILFNLTLLLFYLRHTASVRHRAMSFDGTSFSMGGKSDFPIPLLLPMQMDEYFEAQPPPRLADAWAPLTLDSTRKETPRPAKKRTAKKKAKAVMATIVADAGEKPERALPAEKPHKSPPPAAGSPAQRAQQAGMRPVVTEETKSAQKAAATRTATT